MSYNCPLGAPPGSPLLFRVARSFRTARPRRFSAEEKRPAAIKRAENHPREGRFLQKSNINDSPSKGRFQHTGRFPLGAKAPRTGRPKGAGHPEKERATRGSGRTFGLRLLILPLRSRHARIFRPKNGSRTSACSSDAVRLSCEIYSAYTKAPHGAAGRLHQHLLYLDDFPGTQKSVHFLQ
jgi:hypothetical protein